MLLDDLDCVLQEATHRVPGQPQFLYGHSFGGNLVLNYAMRRRPPLTGLVITSPLLLPAAPPPRWKVAAAHAMKRIAPDSTFHKGVKTSDLSHDREAVEQVLNDPLIHQRVSARLAVEMLHAGRWALVNGDHLKTPTLLMHGSADRVTSAKASRRFSESAGPKCTLKIWDNLYHELHWELQREEVFQTVVQWLLQVVVAQTNA
jgi:alpha-beta hydrolase superfamily lysophospholipase